MMIRFRVPARLAVAVLPLLTLLAVFVLPSPAAVATHQYCGKDAEGVHKGGYAAGTKDNGHPDGEGPPDDPDTDYAGVAELAKVQIAALTMERVSEAVAMSEAMYDVLAYEEPSKEVKLVFSIAKLALGIVTTALDAVVMGIEQRNAEVDDCGGTMLGDMIDTLFVARMQEELAELDPADGTVEVPSSLLVLPDDGAPQWTSESERYPGHKDTLAIPYVDGMANAENIGVAVVVRNTIAHLEAHGINTGGGHKWVQGVGLVWQDGAKDLWWDGIRLLEDGRVRLAHAKFAEAYRMAVSTPISN